MGRLIKYKQYLTNLNRYKKHHQLLKQERGDKVYATYKQIKTKETQRFKAQEMLDEGKGYGHSKSGKALHKSDSRN